MAKNVFKVFFVSFCLFLVFGLFNATVCKAAVGDSVPVGDSQNLPPTISLTNPLGASTTVNSLIGRVINSVLGIVGSLALLMFVYGGLTWMTSSGSAEKVKKGREIIVWSAIGLAVVFMAYGLVRFLITSLQ